MYAQDRRPIGPSSIWLPPCCQLRSERTTVPLFVWSSGDRGWYSPCKGADTPCPAHRREAASWMLSAAKPASVCFPPASHVSSCILRPSRLGGIKGHSRCLKSLVRGYRPPLLNVQQTLACRHWRQLNNTCLVCLIMKVKLNLAACFCLGGRE